MHIPYKVVDTVRTVVGVLVCALVYTGLIFLTIKFVTYTESQNKADYYCRVVIEDQIMFDGECFYDTQTYSRGITNYVKLHDQNYSEHLFTSNKSILFSKSTLVKIK